MHLGIVLFLAALHKYNEINKNLPDRIIVYRDGVGDGQVSCYYIILCLELRLCFYDRHKGTYSYIIYLFILKFSLSETECTCVV